MKYFLMLCLFWITTGQAFSQQGLIFKDLAEAAPPVPDPWGNVSKRTAWRVTTGGNQDPNDYLAENYIEVVTAGGGNPSPRQGNSCYKFYMERRDDLFNSEGNLGGNLQHCRNEFGWGAGCNEFTNARWFIISIFLPAGFCDDNVPMQIAFDMKFGSSVGPASMSLWVEAGKYIIQQLNTEQGGASTDVQYQVPGSITKGAWTDFVVERNFKNDGTGFLRVYRKIVGVDASLQLIYSHTGPNYNMMCGANSEAYLQHGLYKWPWQDEDEQGEGTASSCGHDPITVFYDNYYFLDATATLAQVNTLLAGEGTPTNQPPVVDAGTNQTITLPTSTANLNSTASDPDGTIATYAWTKASGPSGGTISNAATADPSLSALQQGTYVYQLIVTDDDGGQAFDQVTISVQPSTPPPTTAPIFTDVACTEAVGEDDCVSYGTPDQTITLPITGDTVVARAVHQNGGGYIQSFAMTFLSGPGPTPTINQFSQTGWIATTTNFGITGMSTAGTYVYKIVVTDNDGTTANDTMSIVVVAATNAAPTVNAGSDITLTLDGFGAFQVKSTTLNGTATDSDGSIASVQWLLTQGPENSVFGSPTNDTTTFSGLVGGTYIARLIATDNNTASSFDNVTVRVLTCNAGIDQVVALPTNTATLTGGSNSVSDTTDVLWEKISGTGGNITSPGTLSTGITSLSAGEYEYQLTVTHSGGYVVRDRMKITVTGGTTTNSYRIIRGQ